jgi:hypothetical protein
MSRKRDNVHLPGDSANHMTAPGVIWWIIERVLPGQVGSRVAQLEAGGWRLEAGGWHKSDTEAFHESQ